MSTLMMKLRRKKMRNTHIKYIIMKKVGVIKLLWNKYVQKIYVRLKHVLKVTY